MPAAEGTPVPMPRRGRRRSPAAGGDRPVVGDDDLRLLPLPAVAGGPVHRWEIRVGAEDGVAGGVELRARADGRVAISYWVAPERRRQGIGTRAARLAGSWALAHLPGDAVVAIIDEANVASCRLARSAGFEPDGPADGWECSEPGAMLRFVLRRDPREPGDPTGSSEPAWL